MSRPFAINADGRFVFCNELAKTARAIAIKAHHSRSSPSWCSSASRLLENIGGRTAHDSCAERRRANQLNPVQLRRVGKATACPPSTTCSRWWARRKRAFAHPTKLRLGSLAKTIYHSDFNLIWVVQSLLAKIFRFLRRANQFYQLAPSLSRKRGVSRSSRTRDGMRWTRERRRARWSQGGVDP